MTRLKDVAIINRSALPESTDPDHTFRYLDIGSVDGDGRVGLLEELRFSDAPSRARRLVRPGDTILSTVRTYLKAIAEISGDAPNLVVSTGFATLTPRPGVHPRYLTWAIRSNTFIDDVVARSVGVSYPAITATELGTLPVSIPPLDEQQRIADYLDAETTLIDELVSEQSHTRDLLDERLFGLFVHLVATYETTEVPLRRVLSRIADGPFGSAFTSDEYSESGAAVVRLGNIGFAEYRHHAQAFIPLELYRRFGRHAVRPGDLLVAGLGDDRNHAGRSCVAADLGPAIVKGKCFVASVDPDLACPDYLALFMSSPLGRAAVGLAARGSTRTMINLEIAKSTLVQLPGLSDQVSIAAATDEARRSIRPLVDEIDNQIALLRERRQALITHAVTHGIEGLPGVA